MEETIKRELAKARESEDKEYEKSLLDSYKKTYGKDFVEEKEVKETKKNSKKKEVE